MSSSPRIRRLLTSAVLTGALLAGGSVPAMAAPGSTSPASTSAAGTSTLAATPVSLTVSGKGWGHGRGMGQWGALGYAVDHGWSSARILNHFYGGTTAKYVGSPVISVELKRYFSRPVRVTGKALSVNGRALTGAVRVNRVGVGQIRVQRATSCSASFSTWFTASSVTVTARGSAADPAAAVQVCESTGTRGYRGSLRFFEGGGYSRVANHVSTEGYLKGVVPRESPASWGSAGGGRGMEALKSQAVAARSYALASRRTYSTTCDTTACQVYGGWFRSGAAGMDLLEDPRTNRAVDATKGLVRAWSSGRVARTEFSSSTGGFTVGGDFTPVRDSGDATSANPHRAWSQTIPWATAGSRLGVGSMKSLTVLERLRVGGSSTRVTRVRITRTDGRVVILSGSDVRRRLGLKSDWFYLATQSR